MQVQGTISVSLRYRALRRTSWLHRSRITRRVRGRRLQLGALLRYSTCARRTENYCALECPPLRSATAPCAIFSNSSLPRSPPWLSYLSRAGRAQYEKHRSKGQQTFLFCPSNISPLSPPFDARTPTGPYRSATMDRLT